MSESASLRNVLYPKQTNAIARAGLQNDRVDAERQACLLRTDLLPTV